jgi:uncharacterized phage protein (TIGR02218 family)
VKAADSALVSWLAGLTGDASCWMCDLYTFTLVDGSTVYRWTTNEADLVSGGNTYRAAGSDNAPLIERSPLRQSCGIVVDTIDITLGSPIGAAFTINSKRLPQLAIEGYFDGATINIDRIVGAYPGDTSLGKISSLFNGQISRIDPTGNNIVLRCKSFVELLNIEVPKFTLQAQCNNSVYDANCALIRATYTDAGTVVSATTSSLSTTAAAIIAKANGYYNLGSVAFTSGALSGTRRAVSAFIVAGQAILTFAVPLPSAPSAGDTFNVYPGCDKMRATCVSKFNNLVHWRGYPSIPKPESASAPTPKEVRFHGLSAAWNISAFIPPVMTYRDPEFVAPEVFPKTISEQGIPLPIIYGSVKAPICLIEAKDPFGRAAPYNQLDNTDYSPGMRVLADTNYDQIYVCKTGGTSGTNTRPFGTGTGIVDGTVVWDWESVWSADMSCHFQQFVGAVCEGEILGAFSLWMDQLYWSAYTSSFPANGLHVLPGADALTQSIPSVCGFDSSSYQHTAIAVPYFRTGVGGAYLQFAFDSRTKKEMPEIALGISGVMFGNTTQSQVNPSDIINDLITHARRGVGLASGLVDTSVTGSGVTTYRTYCDAAGFRLGLFINSKRRVSEIVSNLLTATNSDAVISGGKIRIVPLSDQAISSPVFGAVNYTPNTTAAYNLGVDDLLGVENPVEVNRVADADVFNAWPVEYFDQSSLFMKATVEDVEPSDVERRGMRRADTISTNVVFSDGVQPAMLSRIFANRSVYVRNQYRLRLPWKYLLLEPTDIITITEPGLGLTSQRLRIVSTEESESGIIVTANDYPVGVYAAARGSQESNIGYAPFVWGTNASIWQLGDGTRNMDLLADGTNYKRVKDVTAGHQIVNTSVDNAAAISGLKLGTDGPLAHLDHTSGALDNLTSITTRSLDNITDGSTYARVLAAALSSGKLNLGAGTGGITGSLPGSSLAAGSGPLSHLNSSGVLDSLDSITTKDLDKITDGTNYRRVAGVTTSNLVASPTIPMQPVRSIIPNAIFSIYSKG